MIGMAKVLEYFGMMRIKKARHINAQVLSAYERAIADCAQKDFGVPPAVNHDEIAKTWANEAFDQMMNEWKPDAILMCSWEFQDG